MKVGSATDEHPPAVDPCRDATAGYRFEVLDGRDPVSAVQRRVEHRAPERVLRRALDRSGEGHELVGIPQRHDLLEDRPTHGERPRLIEDHVPDEPEGLEGLARAHEDPLIRRLARAADDGQWRGDPDRAGIAHDQHTQGGEHGALEVRLPGEPPHACRPPDE